MSSGAFDTDLRHWKVAGGVLRDPEGGVLLVENRRKNGSLDWSTPGGVVDEGESFVGALTREVLEETGLEVSGWAGPLYRVEVTAPDLGFFLEVEAHLAMNSSGTIRLDDPDGIVVSAAFLSIELAAQKLGEAAAFVREPLLDHLRLAVGDGRTFRYQIHGSGGERRVERT